MMSSIKLTVVMTFLFVTAQTQSTFLATEDCLTGKFVDVQNWASSNGSLSKALNPSASLDLSGQPERITDFFDIVAEQWRNRVQLRRNPKSDEKEKPSEFIIAPAGINPLAIKYMSLAGNQLSRIPLASTDNHADDESWSTDAPWQNLRYLSLFGNNFEKSQLTSGSTKSGEISLYSFTINATSWRETVPEKDSLFYFPERSTWAEDLASIDLSSLIELDLRNCSIEVLDDNTFASAPKLERLYLSHNKIIQIYSSAFNGLRKLVHLDISRNTIPKLGVNQSVVIEGTTILRGTFVPLISLRSLDFSFTRIVQTCVTVFDQLNYAMERLSLCYTSFPSIRRGMFSKTALKYLDISGNIGLEDLSSEAFKGIEDTLLILYAKHLGIRSTQSITNLKQLEVLALNDNDIVTLDGSMLDNLQKLRILDLANNRISSWNNYIFLNMPLLDLLILSKNSLSLLSMKMVHDMRNLKFLSLASNGLVCTCVLKHVMNRIIENESDRISVVKEYPVWYQKYTSGNESLRRNESVQEVINFQNAYRYYSMLIQKGLVQLMPFSKDLMSNSIKREGMFQTNTVNIELINSASSSSIWFPDGSNNVEVEPLPPLEEIFNFTFRLFDYSEQEYRCTDSNSNAPWTFDNIAECGSVDLDPKRPENPFSTMTLIIVSMAIIGGILTTILTLVWKWWYVRYFFLMVKNAAMLSILGKEGSLDENDNEYTYDVFVSYCEDDRSWVLDELLPEIEKNACISVCLHERDFQVGLSILENIISCMDRSRALLMVVSNQFLQSQWCQFEMHLAQHRLLETRREQLILVLLEDIPRRRRPNTLHYLMMTKTYIVWPKGANEKAAFWKRLKKSILHGKNLSLERGSSMA